MDPIKEFEQEVKQNVEILGKDDKLHKITKEWIVQSGIDRYSYNFKWMGRPIIQYPQDIIAMQELIWEIKPDLIIETGIAHGGSLIFYASMLELLGNNGKVLGIDIDIREHNRKEIENHSMFKRITMLEGSSICEEILHNVKEYAKNFKNIVVILDSNHTYAHVLEECRLYSNLVSKGSYLVVMDTIIDTAFETGHEEEQFRRSWGTGNSPLTAVNEFLEENDRFVIDNYMEDKLQITVAPSGYLKCVK